MKVGIWQVGKNTHTLHTPNEVNETELTSWKKKGAVIDDKCPLINIVEKKMRRVNMLKQSPNLATFFYWRSLFKYRFVVIERSNNNWLPPK